MTGPRRAALLALCAPWWPAGGALRRVSHEANLTDFGDLVECKVAYDRLQDQCSRSHPPLVPADHGTLVHDADGGEIVNTRGPNEPAFYKRVEYRPPTGRTGVPDKTRGWDYHLHGEDWGRLGECGGPNQSPVDLPRYVDVQGQTKSLLWFDYYVDPDLKSGTAAQLVNDGHGLRYDVGLNGVDLGFVKIGLREYVATEYVFHAPSEHSLDGALFPLELQVHHLPEDGKDGVAVAVFFREGPSNRFLAALKESMNGTAPTWSVTAGSSLGRVSGRFPGAFDLEAIIPKGNAARDRSFYSYLGSITQPPCTSGVNWWVLSTPVTATREEIRFLRRAIYTSPSMRHGNARSSMPLGNRTVSAALAGFQHAVKPHVIPAWAGLDEVKQPRGYHSGDVPWGQHWAEEKKPGSLSG